MAGISSGVASASNRIRSPRSDFASTSDGELDSGNSADTSTAARHGSARSRTTTGVSKFAQTDPGALTASSATAEQFAKSSLGVGQQLDDSPLLIAEHIARNLFSTSAGSSSGDTDSENPSKIAAEENHTSAIPSSQQADSKALDSIVQKFKQRFSLGAENKYEFHSLMKQSFGSTYDFGKAEVIRKQTLQGDFSWMPNIKLVDGAQLKDISLNNAGTGLGAYSASCDTVYLSRDLLHSNPVEAEKILTEEVGHAIDNRINREDAKGDEGDIFSRLVHGENISVEKMTALRQEDDSGTINVNGEKIEVEYGFFSRVQKAFNKVSDFIASGTKKIANAVGKGIEKLTQSKFYTMAARYLPGSGLVSQVLTSAARLLQKDQSPPVSVPQLRQAKLMATLASDAYGDSRVKLPGSVQRVTTAELRGLGITASLTDDKSGYSASVYKVSGKYVVAFRGTNDMTDWKTSAKSLYKITEQYKKANDLVQRLKDSVGKENIQVTGHSLGGGLANYTAVKNDVISTTFNAKGTSLPEMFDTGDFYGARADQLITNYHVKGEALTSVQEKLPFLPEAPGKSITLPAIRPVGKNSNSLLEFGRQFLPLVDTVMNIKEAGERHSMEYVMRGIDAMLKQAEAKAPPEANLQRVVQ